jgi:hypothetical protein
MTTIMTTTPEPRAFELLLGELQGCGLSPEQFERVRAVFTSWGGQQVNVPARRRWLMADALQAARRMLSAGVSAPAMRDRLIGMGLGRSNAYQIIARAREEVDRGAS